jgi:hypothetical protein
VTRKRERGSAKEQVRTAATAGQSKCLTHTKRPPTKKKREEKRKRKRENHVMLRQAKQPVVAELMSLGTRLMRPHESVSAVRSDDTKTESSSRRRRRRRTFWFAGATAVTIGVSAVLARR